MRPGDPRTATDMTWPASEMVHVRRPRPLRESHPPLLGAVRPDHSAIVSRLVGSVLQAILATLLHALPSGALGFQNYADRLVVRSRSLVRRRRWLVAFAKGRLAPPVFTRFIRSLPLPRPRQRARVE